MLRQKILLRLLRSCNYDLTRLSAVDRIEVEELSRRTGIDLPRPGETWGSNATADQHGLHVSRIPGFPTPAPR